MMFLFAAITVLFVVVPFIPCFLEAFWGRDNKPTPITDHQLVDLRDDPERVWSLLDLQPPKHFKEIHAQSLSEEYVETMYCRTHLDLIDTARIWELHVRGDLHVQSPLAVAWWLTARNLILATEVDAVGKIQAREALRVIAPLRFHQLQAGVIDIGDVGSLLQYQFEAPSEKQRHVLHGAWSIPANTELHGDYIIHGDVTLEVGAVLHGSLKVWGSLTLQSAARVSGNIFVTQSARFESGAVVGGVVVVEDELVCLGGNVFGSVIQPTMVVADKMSIVGSVRVYGTLKAWQRGEVSIDKLPHVHSSHPISQTWLESD